MRLAARVKIVYTLRMKALFLLFLLTPFACFAQDEEVVESLFEKLTTFVLGTECERILREGETNIQITVRAAEREAWDTAFYYLDEAFFAILRAASLCDDEPHNLPLVEQYFKEHSDLTEKLVCSYHYQEARRRLLLGMDAIEENIDFETALYEVNWATYYLDEAIDRCAYDEVRVSALLESRDISYDLLELINIQLDLLDQLYEAQNDGH